MDKPANLAKNSSVRLHSNYKEQRDQYIRGQGSQHRRVRNDQPRSQVTTKAFAQPVQISRLTPAEIQARLGETRGAQAAAFVAPKTKADSATFNVFNQYHETVQHFLQNGHSWPKTYTDFSRIQNLQHQRTFPKLVSWFLETPRLPDASGSATEYGLVIELVNSYQKHKRLKI